MDPKAANKHCQETSERTKQEKEEDWSAWVDEVYSSDDESYHALKWFCRLAQMEENDKKIPLKSQHS